MPQEDIVDGRLMLEAEKIASMYAAIIILGRVGDHLAAKGVVLVPAALRSDKYLKIIHAIMEEAKTDTEMATSLRHQGYGVVWFRAVALESPSTFIEGHNEMLGWPYALGQVIETGRWSSDKPNFSNLSKQRPEGVVSDPDTRDLEGYDTVPDEVLAGLASVSSDLPSVEECTQKIMNRAPERRGAQSKVYEVLQELGYNLEPKVRTELPPLALEDVAFLKKHFLGVAFLGTLRLPSGITVSPAQRGYMWHVGEEDGVLREVPDLF